MAGEIGEAAFFDPAPPPGTGGLAGLGTSPTTDILTGQTNPGSATIAPTDILAGLTAPINTWLANIESGFAHFVNVILNNVFYAGIALIGVFLMLGGFYLLVFATPAGKEVAGLVGKAASVVV